MRSERIPSAKVDGFLLGNLLRNFIHCDTSVWLEEVIYVYQKSLYFITYDGYACCLPK
ncbi:hypothetical protein TMU01_20550 [Tenuibacillus multivorans]|nr:hypothetical protein TMU01_20550 [Tenuibacillus multivorans]